MPTLHTNKVAFYLTMTLFSSCCIGTTTAQTSADVIIIGAGLSGLAAAAELKSAGVNVVVLEARDRVGGRTHTVTTTNAQGDSSPVDLGASWIHGLTGNPLVPLAKASGARLASRNTNYDNSRRYYADGGELSDGVETKYQDRFEEFEEYVEEQQEMRQTDPGLKVVMDAFIRQKKLSGNDLLAFKADVNTNYQHEYAAGVAELALWFDEDEEFPGGDKLVIGGYQKMSEHLAKGVTIKLKTVVTEINYSSSSSITIKARSGTTAVTYKAKRVIVTLPIGVLKANSVKFTPTLPSKNRNAIAGLGSGLLNKCVLIFPKVFWGNSTEFINRISAAGDGAWEEWLSLVPATKQPVLFGFNAAPYAWQLEKRTNAETVASAMAALRKIWPGAPSPTRSFVTRWGADPYARGSYSFTTKNMEFADAHRDVKAPVGNGRIQWAGEHTRLDYPGTAHGAYLSGKDAACTVLKTLGKKC